MRQPEPRHLFIPLTVALLGSAAVASVFWSQQHYSRFWFKYMIAAQEAAATPGLTGVAERLFSMALEQSNHFKANDLRTATTLEQLAATKLRENKNSEARQLYTRAINIFQSQPPSVKARPELALDTARCLYSLGVLSQRAGDNATAATEIHQSCQAIGAPSDEQSLILLAACMLELAHLNQLGGNDEQSEQNSRAARHLLQRVRCWPVLLKIEAPLTSRLLQAGSNHHNEKDRIFAITSLELTELCRNAAELWQNNQLEEAETAYLKALNIAKTHHTITFDLDAARIESKLAELCMEKGLWQKATDLLKHAYATAESKDLPLARGLLDSLFSIERFDNDIKGMIELRKQEIGLLERWQAPQSEMVAAKLNLARTLSVLKCEAEAASAFEECYRLECSSSGATSKQSLKLLNQSLTARNRTSQQALRDNEIQSSLKNILITVQTPAEYLRLLPERRIDALLLRAKCRMKQGDLQAAGVDLKSVISLAKEYNQQDALISALGCLAFLHLREARYKDALPILEEAVRKQALWLNERVEYERPDIWNTGDIGSPRVNLLLLINVCKQLDDSKEYSKRARQLKETDREIGVRCSANYDSIKYIPFAYVNLPQHAAGTTPAP